MTASAPAPNPNREQDLWTLKGQSEGLEDDGFNLGKLVQISRRRNLWFGITFGLVLTTVGVVTLGQWLFKPQYRGGFLLLVRDPLTEGQQQGGTELAALARVDTRVDVPTLVDVLSSPMLLEPLAVRLGLPKRALITRVSVGLSSRDSNVLTVNLLWNNPKNGTAIVEALAKEYLGYALRQRKEKLNQGLKFLDEQAPGLQQRVLYLQQELAMFRRSNTMLAPEEQSRTLEESRGQLAGELRSLNQTEARLLGLLAMVRSGELVSPFQSTSTQVSGGQQGAPENISNNFSPLLQELVDVEGELANAQASFRNDSPLVRNLRARRDRLRPLLQGREQDSILSALQVNRVQQQKVNDQINNLGAEFRRNPELIKRYEALQQRLDVARENLGSYLKARETFRLEVAQSTIPWQVISPPQFGVIPVDPNLQNRLLQGLLLGLVAGSGMAYARDRADRVFHSTREIEKQLGLPVLASIPFLPVSTDRAITEWTKELEPEENFALRESLRMFYQSLRTLRANRTLRVMAITSCAASEGKTTGTSLLGQTLEEMGMKVLLVDADLRRARLHRRLGIDGTRGWSELFAANPPALDQLYQWVSPNLAVLPAGPTVPDPVRLLTSERCAEIVQEIRDQAQFDLILFDTPPALELVDPLLVAEHMDGLILLVTIGKINRELPAQVIRKIQASAIDLLGVVVNQRTEKVTVSGYGYGYGYGNTNSYASSYAPKPEELPSYQGKGVQKDTNFLLRIMSWMTREKPIISQNVEDSTLKTATRSEQDKSTKS